LRVTNPANYSFDPRPEDLPDGFSVARKFELKDGYLPHEVLYGFREHRSSLLDMYLHGAHTLEIALRAPGRESTRKTVQLSG
jgi:hypothetical protein